MGLIIIHVLTPYDFMLSQLNKAASPIKASNLIRDLNEYMTRSDYKGD